MTSSLPQSLKYMEPFISYLESLPAGGVNEDVDPELLEEALRIRFASGDPHETLEADIQLLGIWLASFDSLVHPAHWIEGYLSSISSEDIDPSIAPATINPQHERLVGRVEVIANRMLDLGRTAPEPPIFPLTANFYLPSEDAPELSAEAVAEVIREHYPHAIVDWERGRQKMTDDLQRLIDLGCPEILYRGQKLLLDKTIFVKIAVDGTRSCLSGYTFGFSCYDGCLSLECDPFDINALKAGVRRFANDLTLDFDLCAGDVGDLNLTIVPRSLTSQELAAERFPGEHFATPSFTPLNDWKTRLTVACRDWLLNHPEKNVTEKWTSEYGFDDQLAESLIARIESVGSVNAITRVYFGDGKWHSSMVIEYADWTGILDLPGVPSPLLG